MDWSKWNPFKFKRSKKNESHTLAQRGETPQRPGGAPLAWPGMDPYRMMQQMWNDPFASLASMDRFFGDFSASRFTPSIDVVDDGKALRVSAELPGLGKDDVNLTIEEDSLTLRGEKKYDESQEQDGCYRIERAHGLFTRTIPLPTGLATDQADAEFKNGVLEVRIPKLEGSSSGRRVAIR